MAQVSIYQQAWEKLKQTKYCTLVAEPRFHARIIKAMKKRKDTDKAYKFLCEEAGTTERLESISNGNEIKFRLKKTRYGIGDL